VHAGDEDFGLVVVGGMRRDMEVKVDINCIAITTEGEYMSEGDILEGDILEGDVAGRVYHGS